MNGHVIHMHEEADQMSIPIGASSNVFIYTLLVRNMLLV